jgi:hypothetical protein
MGGFRNVPGLPLTDYPTFLHLTLQGKYSFTPRIMGYWRQHSDSVTRVLVHEEAVQSQLRHFALDFLEEHQELLPLSSSERQAIESSWEYAGVNLAFKRGRELLLMKQWQEARFEFRRVFAAKRTAFNIRLAAATGYFFSWLHRDIEVLYYLLKGREFSLKQLFDPVPEHRKRRKDKARSVD